MCDQVTGRRGRPVSSCMHFPGDPGNYRARTGHLAELNLRFSSKYPSMVPGEVGTIRVVSLALRNIIKEEDAVLIPKNRCENFPTGFSYWNFIFGPGELLYRHSIDFCFVSTS